MKGSYNFIKVKGLDNAKKQIVQALFESRKEVKDGVDQVIDIVYRTARAKRPMIHLVRIGGRDEKYIGKKIPKDLREGFRTRSVSDPDAKFGVPVRTGRLRDSIEKESHYIGPMSVKGRVWSDEKYASYVERGTSKMSPRPYMRPAFDLNREVIRKILGNEKELGETQTR